MILINKSSNKKHEKQKKKGEIGMSKCCRFKHSGSKRLIPEMPEVIEKHSIQGTLFCCIIIFGILFLCGIMKNRISESSLPGRVSQETAVQKTEEVRDISLLILLPVLPLFFGLVWKLPIRSVSQNFNKVIMGFATSIYMAVNILLTYWVITHPERNGGLQYFILFLCGWVFFFISASYGWISVINNRPFWLAKNCSF